MWILFTRDSERLRVTLTALGVGVIAYVLTMGGLVALANRIETTGEVYPYRVQDWLRYQVPGLWQDDGKPLLLLAGASNVRENLQVGVVASAFGGSRVRQGGISLATLADVVVSMDYIERKYGAGALPRELVVGLTPRFLAELPAVRPFPLSLELYDSRYRLAPGDPSGTRLVLKSAGDGMLDHARFFVQRSGPRFRAALAWLSAEAIGPDLDQRIARTVPARWLAASWPARGSWFHSVTEIGPYALLREFVAPPRFPRSSPLDTQSLERRLDEPGSWWQDVYRWDPEAHAAAIGARAGRLRAFAARRGMELYLVNLPEHRLSRQRYGPGLSARYTALLRDVFPDERVLDLRCLLGDDEFKDAEHSTMPGSRRETDQVVTFIRVSRATGAAPNDPTLSRQLDSMVSAHACADLP